MSAPIVAIGASWGGLVALQRILGALPPGFAVPLVVVQHRGKEPDGKLAQVLQRSSVVPLVEVHDKQPLEGGRVYLAPADYHLLVDRPWRPELTWGGTGKVGPLTLALSLEPPVTWARPSIDALFESVAQACGPEAVGVVLTGAGRDGVWGLCCIQRAGGTTVVQDPQTAEAPQLPEAALRACRSAMVLPLETIGPFLAARFGCHKGQPRSGSSAP